MTDKQKIKSLERELKRARLDLIKAGNNIYKGEK